MDVLRTFYGCNDSLMSCTQNKSSNFSFLFLIEWSNWYWKRGFIWVFFRSCAVVIRSGFTRKKIYFRIFNKFLKKGLLSFDVEIDVEIDADLTLVIIIYKYFSIVKKILIFFYFEFIFIIFVKKPYIIN